MQGAGQEHRLSHQPSHRRGISTDPDFPHPVSRCIRNRETIFNFFIIAPCFEVVAQTIFLFGLGKQFSVFGLAKHTPPRHPVDNAESIQQQCDGMVSCP